LRALLVWADWDPSPAAANPNHNSVYQIGSRMWKYHAVLHHAGMRLFARENFLQKSFYIIDVSILREQGSDFAQRIRQFT
jgi:hypothetical protein